jgi:hypothetical protein
LAGSVDGFLCHTGSGDAEANLADTIVILLAMAMLQVLILIVLPLARLQWTALGYATAMALNVAGQFLVYSVVLDVKQVAIGGITYGTP